MKKSIFKTGAALMAAVMVMASPITAEAVEGIAYEIGEYRIPSVGRTDEGGYAASDLIIDLTGEVYVRDVSAVGCYIAELDLDDAPNPDYDNWKCPTGYEIRSLEMGLNGDIVSWWWTADSDDSAFDWEEYKQHDWAWEVKDYRFSVNYNNTVYPDCRLAVMNEWGGCVTIELLVPQGYDGSIWYTVYGGKVENGEAVADESSHLTFFLSGKGTGAGQTASAAASEPTPETIEQQPVPETASQPTPVTSYQGTVYVTKPGDNLSKIAKEVYGDKDLWKDIYEQNKELIKNPNVIFANMQLILP